MNEDKQEIILFFKGQIDQIRAVKGSSLARMAVHEAELLLKKYGRDEISLEELVGNYEKIACDFTKFTVMTNHNDNNIELTTADFSKNAGVISTQRGALQQ